MKDESLGSFLKKLTAKVVQKGFLAKTPSYDRDLNILYPVQTLLLLTRNSSTKNSKMIQAIFNQHLLRNVMSFYEDQMS